MDHSEKENTRLLEGLAGRWVKLACSPWALEFVLLFLAVWLLAGPFMKFSDSWQQFMGTVSAAVTLLMVFLLVRTQTKDTLAMHIKLNEVIAALKGANNQLINIENLSETAIQELQKRYEAVATKISHDHTVSTVSIAPHKIVAEEEKQQKDLEEK